MGAGVYQVAIEVLSEKVTPKQSLKKQEAALEIWGQRIPVRGKESAQALMWEPLGVPVGQEEGTLAGCRDMSSGSDVRPVGQVPKGLISCEGEFRCYSLREQM